MTPERRAALEAAGYVVADNPYDWLGLTAEERQMVNLHVRLVVFIQRARTRLGLTRRQMAARLKVPAKQVADIEAGGLDTPLDVLFRALFALGGEVADLLPPRPAEADGQTRPARPRTQVPA